jgi:hypothetical protein
MKKEIQTRLIVMLIGLSGTVFSMHIAGNAKSTRETHVITKPKLPTLEVSKNGEKVHAFWSAGNKANSNYYTLERSKNGINFERISLINAATASNGIIEYVETDYQPLKGISYYRLKCTDFNKNNTYSNIAMVKHTIDNKPGIKWSNNDKNINALKQLHSTQVLVILKDKDGREFYSKVAISVENADIIGYDMESKLSPGTYLITGTSNNILYGQQLIVRDGGAAEL